MIPILPLGSQPQRKRKGFLTASLLALGLALPSGSAEGFAHAEKMKFGVVGAANVTAPPAKPGETISGWESSLGGFFEWKFADWFGLRTGLGYASTTVAHVVEVPGGRNRLQLLHLRRMTVPLVARFYPGSERKFCLYLGPRFGGIVSGKYTDLISVLQSQQQRFVRNAAASGARSAADLDASKLIDSVLDDVFTFSHRQDLPSATRKQYPITTWDFGFEYATRWGLTWGMEGLGLSLGYDFSPLFQDSPAEAAVVQAG